MQKDTRKNLKKFITMSLVISMLTGCATTSDMNNTSIRQYNSAIVDVDENIDKLVDENDANQVESLSDEIETEIANTEESTEGKDENESNLLESTKPTVTPSQKTEDETENDTIKETVETSEKPSVSSKPSEKDEDDTENDEDEDEEKVEGEEDEKEEDNGIMEMSLEDENTPNETTALASSGGIVGPFNERWEYALEHNTQINLVTNIVLSEQLVIPEGHRVTVATDGYQIKIADTAPKGKDRIFYVDGGKLSVVTDTAKGYGRLMGTNCSGDGGVIYVNKGEVYIESLVIRCEKTEGRGKAIYINEGGNVIFALTNTLAQVESSETPNEDGAYFNYIEDSEDDFIYIDGTLTLGTNSGSSYGSPFDCILKFPWSGCIMIGDKAPSDGGIIVDSNYLGDGKSYKLKSTTYPRTVVKGKSNGYVSFTSADELYRCITIDNTIVLELQPEASYNDSEGTLLEMIELASESENESTITLNRDVELTEQILLSKGSNIVLDLNKHTIKRIDNENIEQGRLFSVTEGAILTIKKGSLEGGKSISNGGAIYVGHNSVLTLENVALQNNTAKNGSAIYVEENASLVLKPNVNIYGNDTDNSVIYTSSKSKIYSKVNIDGIFYVNNENKTEMFEFVTSGDDVMTSTTPLNIKASKTPIILTNNLSHGSALFSPNGNYSIVNINNASVLMENSEVQASYTSSSGDTINGSLKEMWNFAKFYGNGTVTLLQDLVGFIGNSNEVPSQPEWSNGFYQMATGIDANIIFDLNGHTLDANMYNLISKAESLGVDRQLGFNSLFSVNQGSTLTLKDSVGSGGIKNIVSGTEYPSVVNICGNAENKSHLIFDNVNINNCHSGKGAIWAMNQYGDIKILNNATIIDNYNVVNDNMTSKSFGFQKLNLYIDNNADVKSDGIGDALNIGVTAENDRFLTVVKLLEKELAKGFTSDDDRYMTITWDNYVQLIDIIHKDEAKFIYPNGEERITAFDDAWSYANTLGGQIDMLKHITATHSNYTYDNLEQLTFNFNGFVLTAISNNDKAFINTVSTIKFIDENTAVKDTSRVTENKNALFDENNKILTYYTTYLENDELVIDENKDDLSNMGGIIATGYTDTVINGPFDINGGRYSSDTRLLYGYGSIKNVYIYNCGNRTRKDGVVYGESTVDISDCVIVGNMASSGTIYSANNDLNISNSIISGNTSVYGGGIYTTNKKTNIDNTFICYNKSTSSGGGINIAPHYEKPSDKDTLKIVRNIIIKNSYINKNEAGTNGGGISLESSDKNSIIENTEIIANKSSSNGGGLYAYDTLIKLSNNIVKQNEAKADGGGIYYGGNIFIDLSTMWLENMNVTENTAKKGGGAYIGIARCYLIGNADFSDNNNTGLFITKSMQVRADELVSGNIPFKTSDIPTRENNVAFAEVGTNDNAKILFEKEIFKPDYYEVTIENDSLYLTISKDIEFSGVLVQYYSYIDNISNTSKHNEDTIDGKTILLDLSVIDTSVDKDGTPLENARIPHNGDTDADVGWRYIYLQQDENDAFKASVFRKQELRMIYDDAELNPNEIDTWDDANIFTRYNKAYTPYQIWILKGSDYTSIKEEDWDIYDYEENMEFDYEPGTIVRLVCKQIVYDEFLNEVTFYDYDISDGYYYTSNNVNAEPQDASTSLDYLKSHNGSSIYVKTLAYGINSDENYSGVGSKYAFGNSNNGTKYGFNKAIITQTDNNTGKEIKKSVTFNKANSDTISSMSFGLAEGLDDNGNIIWDESIDVPNLFNEGEAKGKTTYVGNNLVFKRTGDTYTFTGIDGLNMTGLDDFYFTCWNWNQTRKLWSNNFWPMDNVESFGSNGHDIQFGYGQDQSQYKPYYQRIYTLVEGENMSSGGSKMTSPEALAKSDDSIPHNAFFGMHFSFSFEMPETYNGPLEYYFFGDDEMWIFLDGQIICDIGGVHASIGEYVNLWNYIEKGDTNEHRLDFFYTERGASGSTCWMQFTAPNVYSTTKVPTYSAYRFVKENQYGEAVEGAEFTLYSEEDEIIETQTSDMNGYVTFNTLSKDKTYKVAETKRASDYYIPTNTKYYLEYNGKQWIMYDMNDGTKTNVETVINYLGTEKLPDTGSTDMNNLNNAIMLLMLLGCLTFVASVLTKKRKR